MTTKYKAYTYGELEAMEHGTVMQREDGIIQIRDTVDGIEGFYPAMGSGLWEVLTGEDALSAHLQIGIVTLDGVWVRYQGTTPEAVAKHAATAGRAVLAARAAEFGMDREFNFHGMKLNAACRRFFVPFA